MPKISFPHLVRIYHCTIILPVPMYLYPSRLGREVLSLLPLKHPEIINTKNTEVHRGQDTSLLTSDYLSSCYLSYSIVKHTAIIITMSSGDSGRTESANKIFSATVS
jgi:hypothetical protein